MSRMIACVALCLLFVASCRSNPTGPGALLDGTWTGAIVDSEHGAGTLTLALDQAGPGLAGTWTASFPGGPVNEGGAVDGTVTGTSASLFLAPNAPLVCSSSVTLSGTIGITATFGGEQMSGTYSALTCTGARTGNVNLMRSGN